MRITYIHQYFNTPEMTGGTRSYEMARRLVARGHEVNVVTSWRRDDRGSGWFETVEAGIRVLWLPVPYSNHMGYGERIRAFMSFSMGAAVKAASLPADVVFATSTPLTIALPGVYAARRQRAPLVFEVRDLWPEIPIAIGALSNPVYRATARWLERFAYARSERVVALSPGMRDGVVRAGYPAERVSVIPNSADLEFFDPAAADPEAFRRAHPDLSADPIILYGGTLGRINGVGYLARVAAAAARHGLRLEFVVVGDGVERESVREEAQSLGVLGQNFHMYPAVRKKDMPNVLAAADVALSLFVDLKPMWANSANKFFDALASGTPVAINYGGWQAERLQQYGAGLVLPPDDHDRAANLLMDYVSDRRALAGAGVAARRLAEEQFSRDRLAEQLEGVLLEAVNQ